MRKILATVLVGSLPAWPAMADELAYEPLWTTTQSPGANAIAHSDGRVYVASGTSLEVIEMGSGASLGQVMVDGSRFAAITSVAARGDVVAVSLASPNKTDPGYVQLYRTSDGAPGLQLTGEVMVGVGPDMLTFTPEGLRILVANEGEPACSGDAYGPDPEGSISVVNILSRTVQNVSFTAFNGQKDALTAAGVRIFGPGSTVAQDLEPEHIAVSVLGLRAFVTLQENNAIAVVELLRNPPAVSAILPLGVKDHGLSRNALDVSDRDGQAGNLRTYDRLYGMYLPDGIVAGLIGLRQYLFTANEGDTRDYDCFSEERRVGDLTLSPSFPADDAAALARLRVTDTRGSEGGVFTELYAFGGRSFAVWNAEGDLIYDSGSAIEKLLAERFPGYVEDSRSDDKGPEPEDLALGRVGEVPYLFLGLERSNGVMAFDVSNPASPTFAAFIRNPLDAAFPEGENPERLDFVPASESPTGEALLLVTNEVSGKTRAFALTPAS